MAREESKVEMLDLWANKMETSAQAADHGGECEKREILTAHWEKRKCVSETASPGILTGMNVFEELWDPSRTRYCLLHEIKGRGGTRCLHY